MICACGIRLRQWTDNTYYCPRCREISSTDEEGVRKVIRGAQAVKIAVTVVRTIRKLLEDVEPDPNPSPPPHPTEEVKVQNGPAKKMAECLLCGSPIEDRCGAVCKCGWIKPCGIY